MESSQATSEAAEHSGGGDGEEVAESAIGLSTLEQFIELNAGSWTGTFTVSKSVINRRDFFFPGNVKDLQYDFEVVFSVIVVKSTGRFILTGKIIMKSACAEATRYLEV